MTWVECVPLIFAAACAYLRLTATWDRLTSLRVWSSIRAPYQLAPAQRLHQHLPNVVLVNTYTPTKNCFATTCHRLTEPELAVPRRLYHVPIGRPLPGWHCYLLDETVKPVRLIHRLNVPRPANLRRS